MFSSCTAPFDSKEIKLGSSNQETTPSTGKNIRIVLLPFHAWKCFLSGIFGCVDILDVPPCHLLRQMSSQGGSQNLLQGLVPHELTSYLSTGYKPDNFESNNSLKFGFLNIQASSVKWISLGQLYKKKIDLGQLYKKNEQIFTPLYTHISQIVTKRKEI